MISKRVSITKKDILAKVSECDIFRYYIPSMVDFGKAFNSELRQDDKASCVVKQLRIGTMYYKDLSTGDVYDCFGYVQAKFCCNFGKALGIIAKDFGIINTSDIKALTRGFLGNAKKEKVEAIETDLRIQSKRFDLGELCYWGNYGISPATLDKYVTKSVERYWINGTMIVPDTLCFAYCRGNYKYKIYRPYELKYKWTCNDGGIIQGYDQLPATGSLLIITKSQKDVMLLYELGYNAIAPGSESATIAVSTMDYLKERFNRIVVYYDNDSAGLKLGKKIADNFGLENIHHPLNIAEKDPTDFYKVHGREKLEKLIKELL